MSENYKFYRAKMEELRSSREKNRPLANQLRELLEFVTRCEGRWA
jgi:hypothetical protein